MNIFPKILAVFIFLFFFSISFPNFVFAADSWIGTGDLNRARFWHTATLLNNGNLLVVGGAENTGILLRQAEIYDPTSSSWSRVADLSDVRKEHTAELVVVNNVTKETRVLIVGGLDSNLYSNKAELYNPNNNTWTIAPSMTYKKIQHGSSILSGGRVIITGGYNGTVLGATEIYDPIANIWTVKTSLNTNRRVHAQVTFSDNQGISRVMVLGGIDINVNPLKSTEIYDPSTDTWTAGPDMDFPRYDFSAVALHDGRILVLGGDLPNYNTSEAYDPQDNSWTVYTTSNTFAHTGAVALLGSEANYNVLAVGGNPSTNVQLFDPSLNQWSITTSMNNPRSRFTLTLLNNGTTLAAGGLGVSPGPTRTSEIYTPSAVDPTITPTPTPTQTPTPTPSPTPTVSQPPAPFLDLPWDYKGKGLSFNEGALAINSYFDHEYPYLSGGLSEPASASGTIVTFQGPKRTNNWYSSHDGYDYGTKAKANINDAVLAAASGVATYKYGSASGNMIQIDHENGYQTRYLHLQKDGLIIATTSGNKKVNSRQKIGKVGSTGNSTGAHIHFGVFQDKNNNGNFIDNVPDGATDPFGWQSEDKDPWKDHPFNYFGNNKIGNRSYYLWVNPLDALKENFASNGGMFSAGRYTVEIPNDATTQNLTLEMTASPIAKPSSSLVSIGSTMNITAKDTLGNLITFFTKPLKLTIDFAQFDISQFIPSTLSIYSSADNINWVKEQSIIDFLNKKASLETNHLTYFALMAERADTFAPTTSAILDGQQGEQNWFRGDTEITLNAQDNENGLGIDYTLYRLKDADWESYLTPLSFTNEGYHKIEFYSVDKDETIEEIQNTEFNIDKTSPEAKIFIDQNRQDIRIEGIDANTTSLERFDNTKTIRKDDSIYIIKDLAGNNLKLIVREINTKYKDTLNIYSMQYNQDPSIEKFENRYNIIYKYLKNKLFIYEQTYSVKKEVKIRIKYDVNKNQSTITTKEAGKENLKAIQSGLVLLQLLTENGIIKYNLLML